MAEDMEQPDDMPGMEYLFAVGLAWTIMHSPGWRVDGLQDRAYHPGHWRIHAVYQPRTATGRVSGSKVAKWVHSGEDWQAFRVQAMELNTRNQRSATTRAARQRAQQADTEPSSGRSHDTHEYQQ